MIEAVRHMSELRQIVYKNMILTLVHLLVSLYEFFAIARTENKFKFLNNLPMCL
jgi:hypothetical protein